MQKYTFTGTPILIVSNHEVKRLNVYKTCFTSKELIVWRGKRKGICSPKETLILHQVNTALVQLFSNFLRKIAIT